MSSSARPGRIIRSAPEQEEVFVLGRDTVRGPAAHPAIASAAELRAAAEQEAAAIVTLARAEAAAMLDQARAEAAAARQAAHDDGFAAGRAAAEAEVEALIDLVRRAAAEGKAIRDTVAEQSAAVVARAVALALRRVVGEYYEADPARTAAICGEALRAAAGQDVLCLRVNPSVAPAVQASLVDAARYVLPDEGIAIGGCIVDLAHGRIDASLDARLGLMELALAAAGGEVGA